MESKSKELDTSSKSPAEAGEMVLDETDGKFHPTTNDLPSQRKIVEGMVADLADASDTDTGSESSSGDSDSSRSSESETDSEPEPPRASAIKSVTKPTLAEAETQHIPQLTAQLIQEKTGECQLSESNELSISIIVERVEPDDPSPNPTGKSDVKSSVEQNTEPGQGATHTPTAAETNESMPVDKSIEDEDNAQAVGESSDCLKYGGTENQMTENDMNGSNNAPASAEVNDIDGVQGPPPQPPIVEAEAEAAQPMDVDTEQTAEVKENTVFIEQPVSKPQQPITTSKVVEVVEAVAQTPAASVTSAEPFILRRDSDKPGGQNALPTSSSSTALRTANGQFRPRKLAESESGKYNGVNGVGVLVNGTAQMQRQQLPVVHNQPKWTKPSNYLRRSQKLLRDLLAPKHQRQFWLFYEPVDIVAMEIPDYFDVIKQPMDLGTIRTKMANQEYRSSEEFAQDVRLVISNCAKYNPPDSEVGKCGRQLALVFEREFAKLPYEEVGLDDSDQDLDTSAGSSFGLAPYHSTPAVQSQSGRAMRRRENKTVRDPEQDPEPEPVASTTSNRIDRIMLLMQQAQNIQQQLSFLLQQEHRALARKAGSNGLKKSSKRRRLDSGSSY